MEGLSIYSLLCIPYVGPLMPFKYRQEVAIMVLVLAWLKLFLLRVARDFVHCHNKKLGSGDGSIEFAIVNREDRISVQNLLLFPDLLVLSLSSTPSSHFSAWSELVTCF